MSNFLNAFIKGTEMGDHYRRFITEPALLAAIDNALDSDCTDEYLSSLELKVRSKIGQASVVCSILKDIANSEEVSEVTEEAEPVTDTKTMFELKLACGTKAMQTMGTFEGAGEYEENSTASISATPNEGYTFTGWKLNGRGDLITDNPLNITVDGAKTYKAYFEVIEAAPKANDVEPETTENDE